MTWTASNYKEKLDEALDHFTSSMAVLIEVAKDIPEDLPYWAGIYPTHIIEPSSIRIDMPYDLDKLVILRKALGNKWKSDGSSKSFSDNMSFRYVHIGTGLRMEVILDAELSGSTCKRVQVGVKEEPVWEVRCV